MYEKRNYTTFSNNEIDEEFAQSSHEKRRKTMGDGGDVEGCKLCNCKKTKCLKLYCNCFADGIYCDGNCSCQGCLNKPDYEDTVAETIQKIQSRNPLAFAPKTIQNATEPLNSNIIVEIENHFTPASNRHKRGCNCKKSMCLKKYCECYQAKVGCSNGCNCEGCKNRFGLKEDYGKAKHLVGERDNANISFQEKLEMSNSGNNVWPTDLFNPHNSTPMTPSFEYSNHDNHGSESWFSSGEFFQSPESATYLDYGSSPGLLMNYDGQNMIQNNDLFDYGNALTINDFSPRYHGPHITSHNHPVLSPQDWDNRSQPQSGNSLNWCKSPTSTINYVSGNKFIDTLDYSGLYNTLENDTPEILKETSTLSSVVKVSSSNKKRVSPPHSYMDSGVSSGSSSSPSLRSGHEFILHSVPSFPPLFPYIEFKSDENQSSNGTQDCTERK